MDFSLTTLFVVPSGTLASSGSTQDLTADQLGIFRPDYSLATAGNIAAAKYFYIAQGRRDVGLAGTGQTSKRSDKIAAANVTEWYKTVGVSTTQVQISSIGTFNVQCGEDVSVSVRVHSNMIDLAYANGLTRTVTVKAPCCDCGEVPCTTITAAETETLVTALVAKLQADTALAKYLTFAKAGTGATTSITITGTAPTKITNTYDLSADQSSADRVWFRVFGYTGTPTLADNYVEDVCDGITAVPVVTQRALYPSGGSAEIRDLERYYYSYQASHFKELYNNQGWNGAFSSQVVDGTYYDLYYIKCKEYDQSMAWSDNVNMDFMVIVAFPTTTGSAFETVLTAALGAPKNQSGGSVVTSPVVP